MNLKDCQIARVYRGKFNNLSVTINIKQEDFSPEMEEMLRSFWVTGNTVDVKIGEEFVANSIEELFKKVAKPVKKQSIYQWFKWQCERLGVDYEKEKKLLGVEHLRDMETTKSPQEIELFLRARITDIEMSLGLYSQEI